MNRRNANTKISKWLVGSYVNKLTYYITGWELLFVNDNYEVNSIFSEITITKPLSWDKLIENSPLNIVESNEYEDTLTSIVLFTSVNMHPVISAEIDTQNNLIIEFKNNSKIRIPSTDEMEDCTWLLEEGKGERIKCEWGKILIENKKANT